PAPAARLVNEVGERLLARAGLADDEDVALAAGDDFDEVEHRAHPRAAPDHDRIDGERSRVHLAGRSATAVPARSARVSARSPVRLPVFRHPRRGQPGAAANPAKNLRKSGSPGAGTRLVIGSVRWLPCPLPPRTSTR